MCENNNLESFAETSIKEWGHHKLNDAYTDPDKVLFSLNDIRSFGSKIVLDLGYEEWHKEDITNELNSYRLLFSFISDNYDDDINYVLDILNTVNFEAVGYVKGKINSDGILTFEHPKKHGSWYHAKWESDGHYYTESRRGYLEDEFSGVIVFPTKKKDDFFVIEFWT